MKTFSVSDYLFKAASILELLIGVCVLILCLVCGLGIAFVFCSQNIYTLLSFAFVGVLIPFFYYNVFGTQRKRKTIQGPRLQRLITICNNC